jgi:hypothetical protein
MWHDGEVLSAQFSPDGQRVLTVGGVTLQTARLWDALTGKPLSEPLKHDNAITSAQFSPDGQRVLTASDDKTACLWDALTITSKASTEDLLLLADLADATGGVTLQTSGQTEILNRTPTDQIRATREKIAAKFPMPSSTLTPLQRFLRWSVSDRLLFLGRRGCETLLPFSCKWQPAIVTPLNHHLLRLGP